MSTDIFRRIYYTCISIASGIWGTLGKGYIFRPTRKGNDDLSDPMTVTKNYSSKASNLLGSTTTPCIIVVINE